jgi:hypothetical protein
MNIDVDLLTYIPSLTITQLVLLSLVINDQQYISDRIKQLLMQSATDSEIQPLIDKELLTKEVYDNKITLRKGVKLKEILNSKRDYFDDILDLYPKMVTNDGVERWLHTNTVGSRISYTKYVGNNQALHNQIVDALKAEIEYKERTGTMKYFKQLHNWIYNRNWEAYFTAKKYINTKPEDAYGTELR